MSPRAWLSAIVLGMAFWGVVAALWLTFRQPEPRPVLDGIDHTTAEAITAVMRAANRVEDVPVPVPVPGTPSCSRPPACR